MLQLVLDQGHHGFYLWPNDDDFGIFGRQLQFYANFFCYANFSIFLGPNLRGQNSEIEKNI